MTARQIAVRREIIKISPLRPGSEPGPFLLSTVLLDRTRPAL